MKSYLEISISSSEAQRELLVPTMIELGCQGFQETDTSLLCYIELQPAEGARNEGFRNEIRTLLRTISSNAEIEFREIQDENWNEQWERSIEPIEIGARLVVKPSWASYENTSNRIVIEIDPKMSFGTGYHETTRLMLNLLETAIVKGERVLDVGTGTGILAIASVQLGAESATGIDNDEWSIENATENVARNNVQHIVTISSTPVHECSSGAYDIVCANLTLNTNLEFMEEFSRVMTPEGILLVSGLLLADLKPMTEGLLASHFFPVDSKTENEWVAIAAKRAP